MPQKMIEKVYDYTDENDNIIFQAVRYRPKSFAQRRPFKNAFAWGLSEGWYRQDPYSGDYYKIPDSSNDRHSPPNNTSAIWLNEIEPILYQLPSLIEGIQKEQTIFICEGEKDADNLASLGFTATTCPMGAGKWRSTYTETLRGYCAAVVVADRDNPGRDHAEAVANELHSAGISVKVMEMPDRKDVTIKDFSDWLAVGGTREAFLALVEECANYVPPQEEPTASPQQNLQDIIRKFGEPYYVSPNGKMTSINQTFWASLYNTEHIQLFEPDERAFYRYDPENGLYGIVSEDLIKQEIAARMLEVSRQKNSPQLEQKRNNSELSNIVAQLRGVSEKRNTFNRDKKIAHLANGVVIFNNNCESSFCEFSPTFYSRNQCPITFDLSAKCDRFLDELLYPAVTPDDAVLLQKYAGLCLMGNNLIQRLLILDRTPGRGKSTLSLIIQSLVGRVNVTQLRTSLLSDRFELFRYLKKTLLVGVDVPGQFLSEKSTNAIKGLVGGDMFDAEQKNGTGSFPFQGNFCILITSNSRLQIHLDEDIGAWKRRLLIIRFKKSTPVKKIPDFNDVLIREEGSGILNWALQGLGMLLKDIEVYGDIQLTESQEKIVDDLLAESDSVRHYLVDNVASDEHADLSIQEKVEDYAEYCPLKGWNPKPITVVHRELESLMLKLFKTAKSHSIKREGKSARGFRNVTLKTKQNKSNKKTKGDHELWKDQPEDLGF